MLCSLINSLISSSPVFLVYDVVKFNGKDSHSFSKKFLYSLVFSSISTFLSLSAFVKHITNGIFFNEIINLNKNSGKPFIDLSE